jgi:hypothetical protein
MLDGYLGDSQNEFSAMMARAAKVPSDDNGIRVKKTYRQQNKEHEDSCHLEVLTRAT